MDLRVPVRKAQTRVSGHVLLQETGGATRPLTGVEVAIGPRISYFAKSGPDGAILFPGVYPGRYQLGYVRGLPADTYVLSAHQATRDVFKDDIAVEGAEVNLEIVVSEGAGVLEGKVADAGGRTLHNALVALVPEGPLKERTDYYGAYRDIRTDQNGEFELRGITPGWYRAYAWADAPASAYRNAGFMKSFAGMGTSVRLERGGKVSVELKTLATGR
jgi:hypothetical protein